MVRLKNIKIDGSVAEADFYPEDSKVCGHVVVDLKKHKLTEYRDVPGFGESYRGHAFRQLIRMEKENDKRTECLVMWY